MLQCVSEWVFLLFHDTIIVHQMWVYVKLDKWVGGCLSGKVVSQFGCR